MTLSTWLLVIFLASTNGGIYAGVVPFSDQASCEAARTALTDAANASHRYSDVQMDCIPENKET